MALGCVVAEATDHGRSAPDLDVVAGVLVLLLEEAANSLEEHPQGGTSPNRAAAARAALGLEPGTQGNPLRGRKNRTGRVGAVARWLNVQPESLFNIRADGSTIFGELIDEVAEYVVRREVGHLVTEQRLAQEARRPPLESAMRLDWLRRFEDYYAIWSYLASLRYDIELAVASVRESNDDGTDYFVRESLWYYACFVRRLEEFTCERGGLWVTPDRAAEQRLADAVWLIRKPITMNRVDESVLRIAVTGFDELAVFVQATHTDTALRGLTERWRTWIASCGCTDLEQPHEDCPVHQSTRWATFFMNTLNGQWDLLADWYDVPRPESLVNPPEHARTAPPTPPT
jgi:hypothetical protein